MSTEDKTSSDKDIEQRYMVLAGNLIASAGISAWYQGGSRYKKAYTRSVEDSMRSADLKSVIFSPSCKHSRTSYDIVLCPECKSFSVGRTIEGVTNAKAD